MPVDYIIKEIRKMKRFLIAAVVVSLLVTGVAFAGDITPTQKTTVFNTPTQKNTPVEPMSTSVQKNTPVVPMNTPTQKGTSAQNIPVPIPQELLDALARLQPQPREPGRNLGRAIARCVVKKKISNFVQDNLPSLPPLPLP